jgi:hypothetical protein
MMMVAPVPAAVTDAVVDWHADADIGADSADMGADAHAARSDTGARADTADMGTAAYILCVHRAGREQREGKHRSDK